MQTLKIKPQNEFKMRKKQFLYGILLCTIMLQSAIISAQSTPDDGPEPPPPASINKYVFIMGIIAIAFAMQLINRKRKSAILKQDTREA